MKGGRGRGLNEGLGRTRGDVTFTIYGRLTFIIILFLYAEAYALNNLAPAVLATLLLGYATFARMSFDEELRGTVLQTTRHSKARVFQDRAFPASLEIRNSSPHAIWVEIEDLLPDEIELASGSTGTCRVLEPNSSFVLQYMLRATTRGGVTLDRFKVRLMDERGLMFVEAEGHSTHVLEVEPPIDTFRRGGVLLKRDYVSSGGSSLSTVLGQGYEFGGLRQYQPDDSSVAIEWKASSRLAKLMTKLMYQETRSTVYIFIDSSRSMRIRKGRTGTSKLDHSIQLAVQMATHLRKAGFPVGIGVFDEHRVVDFEPPRGGGTRPGDILRAISGIPKSQTVDSSLVPGAGHPSAHAGSQAFISKILPFFGRRRVTSSEKAAGIYAAVERLTLDHVKGGVVLIFSDLQTNPRSVALSCRIILSKGHTVIVLTPFSPAFDLGPGEITVELLERMYLAYQSKRSLMRRLERMGVRVIEVGKGKEAAAQVSKRLSRRNQVTP